MPNPCGRWPLALFVLFAAQGSWAASRWSASLTLGLERFQIASSQGGAAVDQVPWAGRLSFHYAWKGHLTLKAATGFLSGNRTQKITPARGSEVSVETRLWGYPAELGLGFPITIREGLTFLPATGLGFYRLRYEDRERIGGAATLSTLYRLSGFGGVLSAGLEAKISERLYMLGEVRAGLPLLRESWTEGRDSTQTSYAQDVHPSWSGMGVGFRRAF